MITQFCTTKSGPVLALSLSHNAVLRDKERAKTPYNYLKGRCHSDFDTFLVYTVLHLCLSTFSRLRNNKQQDEETKFKKFFFNYFDMETQSGLHVSLLSLFQALCQRGRLKKRAGDERGLVGEKKERSHPLLFSPGSRLWPARFFDHPH